MERGPLGGGLEPDRVHQLARLVLATILVTFICARILVFLIMARRLPDLFLHVGGTHVHHLNFGILLLAAVGAYLIFARPRGRVLSAVAVVYGVGMGLTFDEFGMWLHLGGSYWQRASWDAMVVVATLFALVAFSTSLKRLKPHHWWAAALIAVSVMLFFILLAESFSYAGKRLAPKLRQIESQAPH
jgi:hypothetical protein